MNVKNTMLIALTVLLILPAISCKKDDDNNTDDPQDILLDKWWYNQGEGRGDHYFKSDGTFEVVDVNNIPGFNYDGTWEWYPSGDSMLIETNSAQLRWLFKEIAETDMSYAPSNEPNNIYHFKTTKN
ncbi:MAG: hypothetical protein RQ866_08890 [Bacteroidales bacterium]|nr:hypothetical protein [Bacteroidales bacterium]